MMKLKPEFKAAWVAALRSGEYAQCQDLLNDGKGFCCLGVACDVAAKIGVVEGGWMATGPAGDSYFIMSGESRSANERSQKYMIPVAMMEVVAEDYSYGNEFRVKTGYDGELEEFTSLTDLNDRLGMSFEQIADYIEAQL
jgi:hypothetical protein